MQRHEDQVRTQEQFQQIAELIRGTLAGGAALRPGRTASDSSRQLTASEAAETAGEESQPRPRGDQRPLPREPRRPELTPRGGGSRDGSEWSGDDDYYPDPDEGRRQPVPGRVPPVPMASMADGLLTGPMCQSLDELLKRAKVDDTLRWQVVVDAKKTGGMAKAGINAISSGKLQASDHFTGEEQMSHGGHIVPEGRGYFPFLQAFVRWIRKHFTPIELHSDAAKMWLPAGSQARIWHDQNQDSLDGKTAGELVNLIVRAFPNHGLEHQKERWADLDTLEKVRKELVDKGRTRDRQTVGDVAMVLEEVAARLGLPQDELGMRLKGMGSIVASAMRIGLTEKECRGEGSMEAMIDNAKQSRLYEVRRPVGGFWPPHVDGRFPEKVSKVNFGIQKFSKAKFGIGRRFCV